MTITAAAATSTTRAGLTTKQNTHVQNSQEKGEVYFMVYYYLYFEIH